MEGPRLPSSIHIFDSVGSTNDTILAAGADGAPEGTTHIARCQTRGRGRGDHRWWSPPDAGLWMSTLLRPRRPRGDWSGLSLLAGVAVRAALRTLGVDSVELFWPNDLYVGSRKLGGILAEVRGSDQNAWAALGVGLNIDLRSDEVRASMPRELRQRTICLVEAGPPSTREPLEIAGAVLASLDTHYQTFEDGTPLSEMIGEEIAHRGQEVEVLTPGNPTMRGVVSGLGDLGELLITTPEGETRAIVSGEVRYEH